MKYPDTHSSPLGTMIGIHRVFGRTPLDALCTFCDDHHWHAKSVPSPDLDALTTIIYPLPARRGEWYPVCVTPLAVTEAWVDRAQSIIARPGDYQVTVRPW
jgi:hypothetical protein